MFPLLIETVENQPVFWHSRTSARIPLAGEKTQGMVLEKRAGIDASKVSGRD
jgi:hypothetical protein